MTPEEMIKHYVEHYEDIDEYGRWNGVTSCEEFEELKKDGFIQDITLGTYNGCTQTFQKREISSENIIEGIVTYLHETEYADVLIDDSEYQPELESDDEHVKNMLQYYDVFTLDGSVYIDVG